MHVAIFNIPGVYSLHEDRVAAGTDDYGELTFAFTWKVKNEQKRKWSLAVDDYWLEVICSRVLKISTQWQYAGRESFSTSMTSSPSSFPQSYY